MKLAGLDRFGPVFVDDIPEPPPPKDKPDRGLPTSPKKPADRKD
jgi:hypothetical protein